MDLRARLGALAERDFRLLFSSTTVSSLGDGVATIALAFAVLEVSGSATDLGLVLAARQITDAAVVLAGGVWADRLPRQRVLLAAASVQGAAQAGSAVLLLGGRASIVALAGLQVLYGAAHGFVIPASTGLVPQTISAERLQEGNALLGLSRSTMQILGPALGGIIVVAGSPGTALAVDAGTFAVAAGLLGGLRVRRAEQRERRSFLHELREGWDEFFGRTWLWTTVVLFGIGNLVFSSYFVLGPLVAKEELGGAGAWATLSTCFGAGAVIGGLAALRLRPRRPLLVSILATSPIVAQLAGIAVPLPVPALAAIAALSGAGLAIHLALWFTVFQQHVPAEAMSRVSSYDALGSFVLIPLGSAVAGPVADQAGVTTTLAGAAAINAACIVAMLTLPSVWAIRDRGPVPPEIPTLDPGAPPPLAAPAPPAPIDNG